MSVQCQLNFPILSEQELLQHGFFSHGGESSGKPPCFLSQELLRRDAKELSWYKGVEMERLDWPKEDRTGLGEQLSIESEGELD